MTSHIYNIYTVAPGIYIYYMTICTKIIQNYLITLLFSSVSLSRYYTQRNLVYGLFSVGFHSLRADTALVATVGSIE